MLCCCGNSHIRTMTATLVIFVAVLNSRRLSINLHCHLAESPLSRLASLRVAYLWAASQHL